jgi:tRNA nucleotidyltransferase/poly(A) polymerase
LLKKAEKNDAQLFIMQFLAKIANKLNVGEHIYVVGGAVRNWLLGASIKDVDIVVDSIALNGKDSEWFANELAKAIPVRTNLTTNQYGVAILAIAENWILNDINMKGEVIEIANARKESYSGDTGKGYKPTEIKPATIEEDIYRREFTFNTLLWKLSDLTENPNQAEIIDITGRGIKDLEKRILATPSDPDKTFSDDPTRMLRAIKFIARYDFDIPDEIIKAIQNNASKLKKMPWDAVRKILVQDIFNGRNPRHSIEIMKELGLIKVLKEMTEETPAFASAITRSVSDKDAELLLDIMDLGFNIKTPITFLTTSDRYRLKELLLNLPKEHGKMLFEAIVKPPLKNQAEIFDRYEIEPKNRKRVWDIARELLFNNPDLALDHNLLENETEKIIKEQHQNSNFL